MMIEAMVTTTTCGYNCWYAREDVCRCYCGGVNHGILTHDGAEQPVRIRKIKSKRFELVGVVPGYGNAHSYVRKELNGRSDSAEWCKMGDYLVQRVSDSKFGKWPELNGFEPDRHFQKHPHFVWKRVG